MGSTPSTSKGHQQQYGDYSAALSASALCAVLGVTGFCWFCYFLCKRPKMSGKGFGHKDTKIRKSSIISVTSSVSVPGDPNGHFYQPPRNPHVYLDTSETHGSRASSVYPNVCRTHLSPVPSTSPTLSGYSGKLRQQQQFSKYFNEPFTQQDESQPPPYPGERRLSGQSGQGGPGAGSGAIGQSESESAGGFVYTVLTDNNKQVSSPIMPRLPPPYSA